MLDDGLLNEDATRDGIIRRAVIDLLENDCCIYHIRTGAMITQQYNMYTTSYSGKELQSTEDMDLAINTFITHMSESI